MNDISRIHKHLATIERLRTALKPFAEVGLPMLRVGKAAVPDGASAHYLKLEPLTAADFRAAALAFKDEQSEPQEKQDGA